MYLKSWHDYVDVIKNCREGFEAMNGENRLLVTDELVEYEDYIQDFRRITDHCRGI
jgi:hypothetical protein